MGFYIAGSYNKLSTKSNKFMYMSICICIVTNHGLDIYFVPTIPQTTFLDWWYMYKKTYRMGETWLELEIWPVSKMDSVLPIFDPYG